MFVEETITEGEPIPFPAVTICTDFPLNKEKMIQLLSNCSKMSFNDEMLEKECMKRRYLLPRLVNDTSRTYFWHRDLKELMMIVNPPETVLKRNTISAKSKCFLGNKCKTKKQKW